jgi:hypothetical protein
MKQFGKECQHAKAIRDNKISYSESERADGCWKCGGELTLLYQQSLTPEEVLRTVHMSNDDRQRLANNPKALAGLVDFLNRPLYHCEPCSRRAMEKDRNYVNALDWLEELKSPGRAARRVRELDAEIAGVEACGPDCPDFRRLEDLRRMRGEYAGGDACETG